MKVADICFVSHVGFCIHQKLFHCADKALKTHWRFFFFQSRIEYSRAGAIINYIAAIDASFHCHASPH